MEHIIVQHINGGYIGEIAQYSGLVVKEEMDNWPEISFEVPATPNNIQLLQNEVRLIVEGEPYLVKSVKPSRSKSGPTFSVTAPSIACELNHKPRQVVGTYVGKDLYPNWAAYTAYKVNDRVRYYGVMYECKMAHTSGASLTGNQWQYWSTCPIQAELMELVLPLTTGSDSLLTFALQDTGWRIGRVDAEAARTFTGTWVSVPSLLQEAAKKYDRHIVYHGADKTVDMVKEPGADNGAVIEYARNLTGITKTSDSTDFLTKMYCYGAEELTFNEENYVSGGHALDRLANGQSFIMDFSYFLGQGFTKDQIYSSIQAYGDASPFIRIGKLELSDYIDPKVLLEDSRKQLSSVYSHPTVTYKLDFVDLYTLSPNGNIKINVGDWVYVRDEELGVDVKVQVKTLDHYPGYPEKVSATLSNKDEFFVDAIANAVSVSQKVVEDPVMERLFQHYMDMQMITINSARGDLFWEDGQLTAVGYEYTESVNANGDVIQTPVLINGVPKLNGMLVRLTPGGLGISRDGGKTYRTAITGDGIFADEVVCKGIHILNAYGDAFVLEANSSGVRINGYDGIVVESNDHRFRAQMQARDDMVGSSWGFSLWNGEYEQPTQSQKNSTGYGNYPVWQVGKDGYWYAFQTTDITMASAPPSKTTGLPVVVTTGYYVKIGGQTSSKVLSSWVDVVVPGNRAGVGDASGIDEANWWYGKRTSLRATYSGQSLVFGVNMNGDGYFKGIIQASDFLDANGYSIIGADGKVKYKYLNLGNIYLEGTTGNIYMKGDLYMGHYTLSGTTPVKDKTGKSWVEVVPSGTSQGVTISSSYSQATFKSNSLEFQAKSSSSDTTGPKLTLNTSSGIKLQRGDNSYMSLSTNTLTLSGDANSKVELSTSAGLKMTQSNSSISLSGNTLTMSTKSSASDTGSTVTLSSSGGLVFKKGDDSATFKANYLDLRNTYSGNTSYLTLQNGNLSMSGNLTLGGSIKLDGNITWGTNSSGQSNAPCRAEYGITLYGRWYTYTTYNAADAATGYDPYTPVYVHFTYDGGTTWTDWAIIKGVKGETGTKGDKGDKGDTGPQGSDANVTAYNVAQAFLNQSGYGLYSVSSGWGYQFYIKASAVQANSYSLTDYGLEGNNGWGTVYGGIAIGYGLNGDTGRATTGGKLFGSAGYTGSTYVIVTEAGARMQAGGSYAYVIPGKCYSSSDFVRDSDRRVKHDIRYDIDSRYEDLFLSLRPCLFRYNASIGTEGGARTHVGLIAQDLRDLMAEKGLSYDDGAFLVQSNTMLPDDGGDEDAVSRQLGIRYGEINNLNILMTQKLYKRVSKLEEEKAELIQRVGDLESRLIRIEQLLGTESSLDR